MTSIGANLAGPLVLALRRTKTGGSGDDESSGGSYDGPPPTPRWVIVAIVFGLLLLFGAIWIVVTSGGDSPEPTITGAFATNSAAFTTL